MLLVRQLKKIKKGMTHFRIDPVLWNDGLLCTNILNKHSSGSTWWTMLPVHHLNTFFFFLWSFVCYSWLCFRTGSAFQRKGRSMCILTGGGRYGEQDKVGKCHQWSDRASSPFSCVSSGFCAAKDHWQGREIDKEGVQSCIHRQMQKGKYLSVLQMRWERKGE